MIIRKSIYLTWWVSTFLITFKKSFMSLRPLILLFYRSFPNTFFDLRPNYTLCAAVILIAAA